MRQYFQIIRQALSQNRIKGQIYYEAHHIVPKSFGKKSSVVLLTPEEHYECHRILAENLGKHLVYGKKVLWAFHRLAYDKQRKLSADEYAEARRVLMPLWTRKKTKEHRKKISAALKGNTNNKKRVFKGMKSAISKEAKIKLSKLVKDRQTGKVGLSANASKGAVICEYVDGRKVEAGSALQLSIQTGIPVSTISVRLNKFPNQIKKGFKIYYK